MSDYVWIRPIFDSVDLVNPCSFQVKVLTLDFNFVYLCSFWTGCFGVCKELQISFSQPCCNYKRIEMVKIQVLIVTRAQYGIRAHHICGKNFFAESQSISICLCIRSLMTMQLIPDRGVDCDTDTVDLLPVVGMRLRCVDSSWCVVTCGGGTKK